MSSTPKEQEGIDSTGWTVAAGEAQAAAGRLNVPDDEDGTLVLPEVRMLDLLASRLALDLDRAEERIVAASRRVHEAGKGLRGGLTGVWIGCVAFVSAPAVLLQWSANDHLFVGDALLYVTALAFSAAILGFIAMLYFTIKIGNDSSDLGHVWAWIELEEPDVDADRTGSHQGATRIAILAVALLAIGGIRVLDDDRGWLLEFVLLVALTPLVTCLLATIGARARAWAQPAVAPHRQSPVGGDVTILNLLNLSYFSARMEGKWDDGPTRRRIMAECERVAAAAELELLPHGAIPAGEDPGTTRWAQEQCANLAATVRQLKQPLLLAGTAEQYGAFLDRVCDLLAAAIRGDWAALTLVEATPRSSSRLRQLLAIIVPCGLLAGAALILPSVLDLDGPAAASMRSTLLIAAVLALVASFTPESQRAAAVIQSVVDKFSRADPTRP